MKTAVIIGGTSGIGESVVEKLSGYGKVIFGGRDVENAAAICDRLGKDVQFIPVDLLKDSSIIEFHEQVIIETKSELLGFFNSAGVLGNPQNITELDDANIDHVVDINLKGLLKCLRPQVALLSAQGRGSIVNCSSIAGEVGAGGLSPYSATKHAILGITKSVALECAPAGVRVNAVSPGATLTPMQNKMIEKDPDLMDALQQAHPLGRIAMPIEVANAVCWLMSEESSFVTGTNLVVDGGYLAK